jgi:sugar phosphate isomerase/epimerase
VTIAPSASAAYRLVEGCDPAYIGVLYDPGNMVHEGFENYRMGMEMLGPYLAHVHVKNAGWTQTGETRDDGFAGWRCEWTGLSRGIVDWPQVITDLKAVGYEGYVGIEDFSREFGSENMLANFAAVMNRLLS